VSALPRQVRGQESGTRGQEPRRGKKRKQQVKFTCGHSVGIEHFEGQDCPHCRHTKRRTRIAAEQTATGRRQKELTGRLPAGSRFDVRFVDEPAPAWSGTLEVPGVGVFHANATAVTRLLFELDRLYRDEISKQ
jgi:hypothetical protein